MGKETQFKHFYSEEANLLRLRTNGARAFVHIETRTRNLEDKVWKYKLCGNNQEGKYRIFNPVKKDAIENRNVIFIETPSASNATN